MHLSFVISSIANMSTIDLSHDNSGSNTSSDASDGAFNHEAHPAYSVLDSRRAPYLKTLPDKRSLLVLQWRSYDCKACPKRNRHDCKRSWLEVQSQRRTERLGIRRLRCVPTSKWRSYDCKACPNEIGTTANVLWLEVQSQRRTEADNYELVHVV